MGRTSGVRCHHIQCFRYGLSKPDGAEQDVRGICIVVAEAYLEGIGVEGEIDLAYFGENC